MKSTPTAEITAERAILNVKQTAEYLGVSESSVWKAIREKQLKPTRLGDRVLFAKVYLDRFAEGR